MKPALLAIAAMVLYASQNVMMEQKLSKFSTPALLTIMYAVMFPLVLARLATMKALGEEINFPMGDALFYALLSGAIYFIADYAFVGAYTNGGSVMLVSTIVVTFPVFAAIIKYVMYGHTPNMYQVVGSVLAFAAVFLVTFGENR